jgi:hypothetical protein
MAADAGRAGLRCLAYDGPPISIEDMDEAVMREALKQK